MYHNDFKPGRKTLDHFSLLLMTLLFVASSQLASAQVAASITGKIEDPSGGAIPGAAVIATSLETGATRTATADEGGNYRVLSLPVGRYEVKVEKEGFKSQVQTGINLVVGQQAVVNLRLELGAVQQQVVVMAEAALVNTTTASVSGLVGERQVKDLPLNGRSFDNLIALNAGAVNFTTNTATATSSNGPRNFFTVAGRRPDQNLFLLNGVEMTGAGQSVALPSSASGQMLGIDAVREFNVLTDAYSAEYGKRPGAQISIVTQSGTNQIHGTAFEFLRNSALDARNFFDQETIGSFKRNQFGGALGGPIRKDKTFLFGNYEGFRQRLGLSNLAIVPDLNARQGLLPNAQGVPTPVTGLDPRMLPFTALWPLPNGRSLGGGFALSFNQPKQTIRQDYGTARLDHNFSEKDSVSANYAIDDGFAVTPAVDPLFGLVFPVQSNVASLQEQHIFSPQTINTARVGFSRAWEFADVAPLVPLPPSLSFFSGVHPGNLTIGAGTGGGGVGQSGSITPVGSITSLQWYARNLFTYADDVQRIQGKHQISFGVWLQRLAENRSGSARKAGLAAFPSLTAFLQGTVTSFTGVPNPTPVGYRMLMGAWYVQDTITLRPNLTLRLGLRHEFTNGWNEVLGREANFIPGPDGVLLTSPLVGKIFTENNAKWLFNPRVGLSWDPFGKGKTSIRAGLGIYHQLQDELGFQPDGVPPFNGNVSFGQNASFPALVPVQPGKPAPPACGPGVPSPCAIYAPQGIQPNLKTPTATEWNFTVEQQITPNTAVHASYVGSRSVHQIVSMDPNAIHAQICSSSAGCSAGGVLTAAQKGAPPGVPVFDVRVPQGTLYIPAGPGGVPAARPNPYLSNGNFWNSESNASYNALQLDLTHRFSHGVQFRGNYTWSKNLDTGSALVAPLSANAAQTLLNPYDAGRDWGPSAQDIRHQASLSGSYELPLGHGKPWLSGVSGARDKLVGGWQVNWILTMLSGFPFTPAVGSNQSGNGDTRNPDRPNLNPAFSGPIILGRPNQWFNPRAFQLPVPGTFGNLGKATLRGPNLRGLDLSLFKTTALTERLKVEYRAEFFNVLNHSNFSFPSLNVFSGGAISPAAGVITATATTSRQIQFGLKLSF